MKNTQRGLITALVVTTLVGLGGCSGMTTREKSTAIGAGVGGVAGAVLCGGVLCTAAGAVAGGVIGHETSK